MDTFGLSLAVASVIAGLIVLVGVLALWWCVQSAPPRTIVMTTGPGNSTFSRYAARYAEALKAKGVTLTLLPSQGSQQNLERLKSGENDVDIGFVQGGLIQPNPTSQSGAAGTPTPSIATDDLVSLGSVAYQPMMIFYRGEARMERLSELAGKRIAVGPVGSGTRTLALALLQVNGIAPADKTTEFVDLDPESAGAALMAGKIDAVFLMGDSAPTSTLRTLLRADGVRLYSFTQADAYVRRFAYLNRITLPAGSIDLGKNLPSENVVLVGPTVELIARENLHPALSDVLLDVAQQVHGRATMMQRGGEFPAPLEHEFKISEDAKRFYKSGKSFLYRSVRSFWLASMLDRILVVFVPMLIVLIPTLRFLPVAYRWSNQLKIYRCYRPLLQLEREAAQPKNAAERRELMRRLDEIEAMVNRLKVPASFAEQFYFLRSHIGFVRARLCEEA